MSAPPTPPDASRNELTSALVWAFGAAVVAVFAFFRAGQLEEKRTFYLIAGAVAAVIAVVNGYSAWVTYKKAKTPPAA
jgi:membrane protein DedA with SNARE-associated domain